MSAQWNEDVSKNLIKLAKRIRSEIESKVTVVQKTILINGQPHTCMVKVCPALYGTGAGGSPMTSEFNYEKPGNKVK